MRNKELRASGIRPARWRREGFFKAFRREVRDIWRLPLPLGARLEELASFLGFMAAVARHFTSAYAKPSEGG